MPKLRVTIIDEVRNRRLKVDLPDDAAMEKLLPALAEKLSLPTTDPAGQPIAYQLTHEATGRALGGGQTLASFGVREGDALRLATAREEAPIVPGPAEEVKPVEMVEEEEAVPLWQKVPVWGWVGIGGVVLLVALAGVFLAGRGAKPEPTPAVVAEITTPTATPVPPAQTPTRIPWPTPTPTATIGTDPTVYDNFNNPANDGSFNQSQWTYWTDPPNQIVQQDGILIVTQDGKPEKTALAARKYYKVALNTPTFFEARLMLSPDQHAGNVHLHFWTDRAGKGDWFSECHVNEDGWATCFDTAWPWQEGHGYDVGEKSVAVGYGTWHTFRIEVDPATMTFTYYIDGQRVGSHVPVDAEELKKAGFTFSVGVWGPSSGALTGYIDDVRIGPVQ